MSINLTVTTPEPTSDAIMIPLNKLKPSPSNARKIPHSTAHIEALAASIAVKGILQNLVVEPELDAEGALTGNYLVTIGEGRRQAQMLRAKRKEIKKTEPVRCVVDTVNDPAEISLDENVNREAMHPAEQFERFRELSERKGWGAEEIGARFGVTAHVVRQRLRLGAVSPKLMQVYRDGGLSLDQLMGFAIKDDHQRQEEVFNRLNSWDRGASTIRQMMTETLVSAGDRRASFVGADAYLVAGGTMLKDLFSENGQGYFEDVSLLDRLALEKLHEAAEVVKAEGWQWVKVSMDYPYGHGLDRYYPNETDLSEEAQARLDAVQAEYDALLDQYDDAELPGEIAERMDALEAELDELNGLRMGYAPEIIVKAGAFVCLNHDGTLRVERGFVQPQPQAEEEGDEGEDQDTGADQIEEVKSLPESLVRDLTAHRTLGLRLALAQRPDVALIALTHSLAERAFYLYASASALEISSTSHFLGNHADGIGDTAAAKALAELHDAWAAKMPKEAADLWDFVASLDEAKRAGLLAHCVALTVDAVDRLKQPEPKRLATADKLATALAFDMTAHWQPTAASYFGRITKSWILDGVRDALGEEAADRIAGLKKQAMAEEAEKLLFRYRLASFGPQDPGKRERRGVRRERLSPRRRMNPMPEPLRRLRHPSPTKRGAETWLPN